MRIPIPIAAILLVCLNGCASIKAVPVEPEASLSTSYEIGTLQTATTGSRAVRVARLYTVPTFSAIQSFMPPSYSTDRIPTPEISDLIEWMAVFETQNDDGYVIWSPEYAGDDYKLPSRIHITKDGRIAGGWLWSTSSLQKAQQGKWPKEALFAQREGFPMEGSFVAELLYSGRSGNVIQFRYREYIDGALRPAFTQDLTYDLSEEKTVRFKSIEIEVEKATNSEIVFRVVDDGGLDWLP